MVSWRPPLPTARPISKYSLYPEEEEVLFPAGTQFQVRSEADAGLKRSGSLCLPPPMAALCSTFLDWVLVFGSRQKGRDTSELRGVVVAFRVWIGWKRGLLQSVIVFLVFFCPGYEFIKLACWGVVGCVNVLPVCVASLRAECRKGAEAPCQAAVCRQLLELALRCNLDNVDIYRPGVGCSSPSAGPFSPLPGCMASPIWFR